MNIISKSISTYSQFQTSELHFLGCPAGRLFQNEYLGQETEQEQIDFKLTQKANGEKKTS